MTFRDEGDAILARVRALTRELSVARREIEILKAQLRGESGRPGVGPHTAAAEIREELESARTILAGLIGDQRTTSAYGAAAITPDPANKALREALRGAIRAKLGSVDVPTRKVIDKTDDRDRLISLIAAVSKADDAEAIARLFRAPGRSSR